MEYELVEPRAAALVESLRAFGYDLGSAIADLIDNSISAGAKNIWIEFIWDGENSLIGVSDDGQGMEDSILRNAMRLGSQNPNTPRSAKDLGRFGMGMKTASFSQCRCVTIRSKIKSSQTTTKRWDLDHLARTDAWQVLLNARENAETHFERLVDLRSGTCVLWQTLDRIPGVRRGATEKDRETFFRQCEIVEQHLGLTFHRILQSSQGAKLFINNRAILPDDPFFITAATQILQEQNVVDSVGNEILIEPFVMPHESKLADSGARAKAGDSRDWRAKQGFYIYRQDRLLVAASWFGFRGWRKDEFHKLARIRISLTNSSDEEWQIDVTKQKASPPESLKACLQRIGRYTRERAKKVYSFRGSRTSSRTATSKHFVWEQIDKHGETSFSVNREHPLIASLLKDPAGNKKRDFVNALKLIEQSIPVRLIASVERVDTIDSLSPDSSKNPEEIQAMLVQAWRGLREQGFDHTQAISLLSAWEPFDNFPDLLAHLEAQPPY